MKTLIKSLLAVAIATTALVSCQKEADAPIEKGGRVHFILHAGSSNTKTGVQYSDGQYSPYWNSSDELGVLFNLPSSSKDLKNDAVFSNTNEEDGDTAVFEGDAELADGEDVTFYSYYPASAGKKVYVNDGVVTIGLDVPTDQTPVYNGTFGYSFDPAADLLIAQPTTCFVVDGTAANDTDMFFSRLTGVLRVELNVDSDVSFYGETVTSFKIETSSGDIAGRVAVNPITGVYSKTNSVTGSTSITATYDPTKCPINLGKEGLNNVFLCVAPVTIPAGSSLVFTIKSKDTSGNIHTIVKTVSSTPSDIAFESAMPTVIRLNLTRDNISEDEVKFFEVKESEQIATGAEYLITSTKADKSVVALAAYNSSKYYGATDVSITEDTDGNYISITAEPVITVTLEDAGNSQFFIKDSENNYLFWSSGNNIERGSKENANKFKWTVSTEAIANVGTSTRVIQYNRSNPRFACYTGTQAAISLYVKEGSLPELEDPQITFGITEPIDVAWDERESFVAPVLTKPDGLTASYTSSNEDVATVDSSTGEITFVGNGTTIITATTAQTSVYAVGSANYTINVSGKPAEPDFTTVAGLNGKAANEEAEYSGTLTNAIVSYVPGQNDAIIKDETGSILLHITNHNLEQGQTFSGTLNVTVKLYNKCAEILACDADFIGDPVPVDPANMALSDLVGNLSTYQNAYVKVENLEVTNISGKNISVKNGNNTYVVYYSVATITDECSVGDIIRATGTIANYSSKDQIKVWSEDGLKVTGHNNSGNYVLTPVKSTSNTGYANSYSVSISGVDWSVPGNQNFDGYWRIGGKSLTNVNRVIYGESAIKQNVSTIIIATNGVSNANLVVNSITVTAHSTAAWAASESDPNAVTFTTSDNLSFAVGTAKSITFTKNGETDLSEGYYYRIVFNVSNSKSSNYGLDLTSITFE